MSPATFTPTTPADFIGPAARLAEMLASKASLASLDGSPIKILIYGAPGLGKTALAKLLASLLTTERTEIEHYNGKQVGCATVQQWIESSHYTSIFGGYRVWHVDEIDRMSRDAQDLSLTFLDQLKGRRAFIGTSNLQLDLLQERFQTRLQQFKLGPAKSEELSTWLQNRFGADAKTADRCAVGSGGNVRAALMDLQSFQDFTPSRKGLL